MCKHGIVIHLLKSYCSVGHTYLFYKLRTTKAQNIVILLGIAKEGNLLETLLPQWQWVLFSLLCLSGYSWLLLWAIILSTRVPLPLWVLRVLFCALVVFGETQLYK